MWTVALSTVFFIGVEHAAGAVVAATRMAARLSTLASTAPARGRQRVASAPRRFRSEDVAVLMAAHNEAAVLADSLRAASALLPPSQIHVVSDGSSDATVAIAEESGVHVLDLNPNRGKAGALAAGIKHFALARRFRVILLLDADTRLSPDYLETGLPLFNDPDVVAVSGVVKCLMDPPPRTMTARFLLAYRARLYVMSQNIIKFGQAARWANVMPIIPGFASMYRTDILSQIEITKPGLVIEDINMTFEVHTKKLGRVAFHPNAAVAFTQDPDNWPDYARQVRRWMLGYWQTVRSQSRRIHISKFWAAVALQITELFANATVLMVLGPLLLFTVYSDTLAQTYGRPEVMGYEVIGTLGIRYVLLGFFLPDMLLTVFAAITLRRPGLLLLAPLFPFVRFVDAYITLRAIPTALRTKSSGAWVSPARRAMEGGRDAIAPTPSPSL